jgi:superfamily II DNA or RNA helicase
MNPIPYKWQERFLRVYKGNGVIKAFAGTGKTYATILLLKKGDYNKIIIGVPTRKLKHQWIEQIKKYNIANCVVETFHILSKEKSKNLSCEILIIDECHRSTSPVFKKIYTNIAYDNILGLSATPNRACLNYCGSIIIEVNIDEAQISDFTVFFHSIDLDDFEMERYEKLSEGIGKLMSRMRRAQNEEKWSLRNRIDSIIFKRRSIVYMAEARIPKGVSLINKNNNKSTLVICKRIEQANKISKLTKFPVYHSERPDEKALDDFQNDRINTLISVGMLSEGYDKKNIKCLIIVSTAITEAYHIQSIGRAVRLPDDAEIHIILARKTTDEKLLQFRFKYKHKIVGDFSPRALKPRNPWTEQYFLADEYKIDLQGRIYQKNNNSKHFFKYNSIVPALERVFNFRGGKFRITKDNLVLVKVGGKIISLGILSEPLAIIKRTKLYRIH